MLPKWYDKWIAENPKDIYGPAILIGVVGGAVLVAALLVTWGRPFPMESVQTGPRGTGMSVTKFVAEAATPDPTVAAYTTAAPVPPQPGDPLARFAVAGAEPLLGDLTVANYERLVNQMRVWTGIPDLLAGEENYQTVVARRMIEMTRNLNENWSGHVNPNGNAGVNCYTCHRGQPVPSGVWFRITPVSKATAGWAAVQNRTTVQSGSTSLPSDALEKYLLEAETIAVHDLESRVAQNVTDGSSPTWQNAERTFSLMNYFDNALGVNCVFCHNSRAFYDVGQNTPQWALAQLAIGMVQELNNDYMVPLTEVLPPERLGVQGDVPKIGCLTCHKGYQKPMGGMDMISDWPELASSAAPVYQ
jgi:photosynthetic reaction center cytochrome c subunit